MRGAQQDNSGSMPGSLPEVPFRHSFPVKEATEEDFIQMPMALLTHRL
jgi:hypothetical protein